jgi:hypothetical protein
MRRLFTSNLPAGYTGIFLSKKNEQVLCIGIVTLTLLKIASVAKIRSFAMTNHPAAS